MGDISKNFSLKEFVESPTAKKLGLDNSIPNDIIKAALVALVTKVLQPLRDAWGKPLEVNSGYRCKPLNVAVGGVESSQHRKGEAADIATTSPYTLAKLARDLNLPYDQMILYPTFVHFSHKRNGVQRRRILYNSSYKGKRTL